MLISSSSVVLPHLQPPPQSFRISAAAAAYFTQSLSSSRTSSTHSQLLSLNLYQYQPPSVHHFYECTLFLLWNHFFLLLVWDNNSQSRTQPLGGSQPWHSLATANDRGRRWLSPSLAGLSGFICYYGLLTTHSSWIGSFCIACSYPLWSSALLFSLCSYLSIPIFSLRSYPIILAPLCSASFFSTRLHYVPFLLCRSDLLALLWSQLWLLRSSSVSTCSDPHFSLGLNSVRISLLRYALYFCFPGPSNLSLKITFHWVPYHLILACTIRWKLWSL